jgi:hypothetical protein
MDRGPIRKTLGKVAPYLVLGPVSGPLTAGVVVNLRGGRPFLAGLYGFLLASWLFLAPVEAAQLLPSSLAHWF